MSPEIIEIPERTLVGIHTEMSLTDNKTRLLWQQFMPRRHEIQHRVGQSFYSMQVYAPGFSMQNFTPHTVFTKWAAIEVSNFENIPKGMHAFTLPEGKYAVFIHKGPASAFKPTFDYIFSEWLPKSAYMLDQRPHFELLPEGYIPTDPNAEEEVWIPIK
ncbi:GyrI-like domain-containing protein [uncultured Microscilla sp.]|uniref:GyrI-like domain-containing protein n=1 Tax=uncultured Microscilla sp. TaxID=432653 RepID=UPI002611D3B2|nr:GyrI-like domain-containing protein [uncultured Microscilla sp.]